MTKYDEIQVNMSVDLILTDGTKMSGKVVDRDISWISISGEKTWSIRKEAIIAFHVHPNYKNVHDLFN